VLAIRYKPGSSVAYVKAVEALCGSACACLQGHGSGQEKWLLSSIAQAEPRLIFFEGARFKLNAGNERLAYNKSLQATRYLGI
jgi:hypothetical protein